MALTQISTQGIKDGTITGSDLATNVDLVDDQKLRFGTGNDLEIYGIAASGTAGIINHANGDLLIKHGADKQLISRDDGAIELYHDDIKKFETTSDGVKVKNTITLEEASGSESYQLSVNSFGGLDINNDTTKIAEFTDASTFNLLDNIKLTCGTDADLQIYHDGSNSYIQDVGTGGLIISSDYYGIDLKKGSEYMGRFITDGQVELYHDNSKKFETTSSGVAIEGNINATSHLALVDNGRVKLGNGDDLQLYHTSNNSFIINSTGTLDIRSAGINFRDEGGNEDYIKCVDNGAVELYHDNSKMLETTQYGVNCTASLDVQGSTTLQNTFLSDNDKLNFGGGNDLQIYHDGTDSYLQNATGDLYIQTTGSGDDIFLSAIDDVQINVAGNTGVKVIGDGAVELYYDNSKKLETTSTGASVTGNIQLPDDGEVRLGADNDIRMFHSNTQNLIQSYNDKVFRIQSFGTSAQIKIQTNESENNIICSPNAGVELYYDNNKKFETLSDGVNVTGTLKVNGSALTGGKVLQVVSVTKTDTASNSTGSQSTWEFNDSSLRVQITGSSTSNKFLFLGQVTVGGEIATHIGLRDGEDSSNVTGMMGTNTSNRRASTSGKTHGDSHAANTVPIIGLISVPDTNQHTYYFQFSHTSGGSQTIYINTGSSTGNNAERGRYISSLTVMEISA